MAKKKRTTKKKVASKKKATTKKKPVVKTPEVAPPETPAPDPQEPPVTPASSNDNPTESTIELNQDGLVPGENVEFDVLMKHYGKHNDMVKKAKQKAK